MTETTVTEAIRARLAEGLTSGEIIARGYRPGTVYKVQRSLRLAAALASEAPAAADADEAEDHEEMLPDPEDGFEDDEIEGEETADDRIAELEARLSRVDQQLANLHERLEGRLASITSQFSDVWLDLSRIKGQVPKIEEALRWLRESAEDAITLLARPTAKPANIWGWLHPHGTALLRIRRRFVEIDPAGAEALFGDRIEQVTGRAGLVGIPPKRKN